MGLDIFIAIDGNDDIVAIVAAQNLPLAEAYLMGAQIKYGMLRKYTSKINTKVEPILLTQKVGLIDPTTVNRNVQQYILIKK